MVSVGILGASGYTALELAKLLVRHPHVKITALTSRQEDARAIGEVHPQLNGRLSLNVENLPIFEVARRCQCVFGCLPHAASAEAVRELLTHGTRVIDLSADYRLGDPEIYRQWYEHAHPDPNRLGSTPYGLPEWFDQEIREAQLVANPGCYPTSAILPLAPLLRDGWIDAEDIIIDSKSGVSGAGRTPKLTTHFPECNESVSAYAVGKHRHTPEIERILGLILGRHVAVIFTPHLIPMDRGILTTTYSRPIRTFQESDLLQMLRDFYSAQPFIRVVDHFPATKDTMHTNFCDITARIVRGRVVTISCIDNLIKGASGAAVQNMNVMFGFDQRLGLI